MNYGASLDIVQPAVIEYNLTLRASGLARYIFLKTQIICSRILL